MSAAARLRKVGEAAPPEEGPAKIRFADWLASDAERVPDVVTGLPDTEKIDGKLRATLETVPAPPEIVAINALTSASIISHS
jgi:hypothetical protein